ncbi:hypothetical protein EJ110_NYTH58974 [Nymphaea thermarum]|nr:hypothetical protein EJ110_NYTH58974 [Nymphaea thermarum]
MSEISSEANTSSFVSSGEMKSSPFSSIINKMNGGNYEMWAMQVKRTLIAHDKEHLILEPEPVQKVGKYTTWFKDNSLVMVWIAGTLSQDIANEVLHKESAKDSGILLQLRIRKQEMKHELCSYIMTFIRCDKMVGLFILTTLVSSVFLSGLDSVYESAKNQMLTSPSIPPIDEAYSRLSRIPIPAATVHDTTSAMLATRGRGGSFFARGRGGRGRGTPTLRPVCQFCHRIGHTVDKCWQKHGRPAFANQIASTESSEPPKAQHIAPSSELRVDDLLSQLRSLIGDRPQHAPDPTTSTVTTAATASSSSGMNLSIEPKYSHIFWTPCVAHILNFALKSICNPSKEESKAYSICSWIEELEHDDKNIRNFVVSQHHALSIFNKHSDLRLLKAVETPCAARRIFLSLRLSLRKTPLSQPAPPDGLPPPVRPDVSAAARRFCLCLFLRRWTVCLNQRRPTPLSQSPVAYDSADVASPSARRCCIYLSHRRLSVPPRRLLHLTSALLTSSLPAPATLCSATTSFCSGSGDLLRRPDSGDLVCSTPCYWFFVLFLAPVDLYGSLLIINR